MAEGAHSHTKKYLIIFAILAVLTAIEIAIPEMSLDYTLHAVSLSFLAVIKAGLVGWYYMHLEFESNWLKFISLIPISAFIYAVVLMLETGAR